MALDSGYHSREFNKGLFIKYMGRVPRNQKGQSNMPDLVTARDDRGLKGQERRESWKGFPDRRGGPRSRPAQPSLQGGNQDSAYSVYSLFCHIYSPLTTSPTGWTVVESRRQRNLSVQSGKITVLCRTRVGRRKSKAGIWKNKLKIPSWRRGGGGRTAGSLNSSLSLPREPFQCWLPHLMR